MTTQKDTRVVLCVDLDGTLVATDTLDECLLCLLRHRPWMLCKLPIWLLLGKARFKAELAAATNVAFGPLPYRESVLKYINDRGDDICEVVLATAANQLVADRVARECNFIEHVLASNDQTNLSGEAKLAAIREYSGGRPFDYIGDQPKDLPIWRAARQAIVVSGSNRVHQMVNGHSCVTVIFPGISATARDWLKQLRVHQWTKNVLLLLPLILAHKVTSLPAVIACVVAVIAFSCSASAVYIINDLIDLPHDRNHSSKRNRPLARGAITIRQALLAAVALLTVATILSVSLLPISFLGMLAGYCALSFAYSIWLKRVVIVDILLLSSFYVYRVLAGAVVIEVSVSFWLIAFSMFFFLSLGIIKRYADLVLAVKTNQTELAGRSYTTADIDFFRSIGISCSCVAVLVLALYLQSQEVTALYARPKLLWFVCPLAMYWIMRVWLIASRGLMPDDPINFVAGDRVSYIVGALTALLIVMAAQ